MPETTVRSRKREADFEEDEMFGSEIDGLSHPDSLEDDLDEDIDDLEGDIDDEGVRLMNVERPSAPPRKPKPGPRPRTAKTEMNKRIDDSLNGILSGLEFGTDAHKINVVRMEPAYDPDTNVRIAGLLESFRRPIEVEDIQKKFGGGIYAVTVHGPSGNGRRAGIVARRTVEVAGPPHPLPPSAREQARQKQLEENKADSLVENLMEQQERARERQERHAAELRKELAQKDKTMIEMIAKIGEQKTDPTAAIAPLLQAMSEQQARQEQARREETARLEAQRREDREEQRRRDEERQRQWQSEQSRQEQQFKLQMEQIKADQARAAAEAQQRAEAERNNMQFMLSFMTKTDAEKEARSRESQALQMQMYSQMNEQNSRFSQAQIEMMKSQLENKDDFFGSIEKFATIRDLFNPPDPGDERETWEKVADRVGEILPMGLAALSSGKAQQQGAPPLPPGGGPRRVAPGSVVIVEDLESDLPQQLESHEESSDVGSETHQEPQAQEQEVQATTAEQENQLTEFPDEYPADFTKGLTLLVMSLDLALQRELSDDEMYEKTVAKLPSAQKMLLKGLGADTLVDYIEEKAGIPDTWAIRSLEAEDKIRSLHARLVSES